MLLNYEDLPAQIPLMPLCGVLLLPGGTLRLTVVEAQFRQLVEDAMGGSRLVGLIQPSKPQAAPLANSVTLCQTGCVGRIIAYRETPDGGIAITLQGICRFGLVEELATTKSYRNAVVDFSSFRRDMYLQPPKKGVYTTLIEVLREVVGSMGAPSEWHDVEANCDRDFVIGLAMGLPIPARDRQAVLEARTEADRARMLAALIAADCRMLAALIAADCMREDQDEQSHRRLH